VKKEPTSKRATSSKKEKSHLKRENKSYSNPKRAIKYTFLIWEFIMLVN